MHLLHLRLLGEFSLEDNTVPDASVITPRLQSLLAYLVLHRDAPQPRQHLAFLLWPDSSEARAHNSLRQLLFGLRAVLPGAARLIHADRLTVQWQPDPAHIVFSCDVDTFEQCARSDSLQMLHRAVDMYRGDLLPGLYDEWVLTERERLRGTFWTTLERLLTLLEDRRAYAEAIPYGERQIHDDPMHEPAYERLMRLHALSGSRAGALQVYHQCATVLRRELGVEPGPALQAAHARLLDAPSDPTAPLVRLPTQHEPNDLIGRIREWVILREMWQRTAVGRPHIVVLTGDPGVGKTRLAEELVAWAIRQGIATATARCYADEADRVYAPVTAWLRSSAFHSSLPRLDPVWRSELTRILPELLTAHPELTPPGPLTERWQRARFRDALMRAIMSCNEPLLLFLDDIQWCDSETLMLLPALLRFAPASRTLLVATLRPEELNHDHPIGTFRPALQRDGMWIEVALAPLTATDTTALAVQATGQPLSCEAATWLYRETEGNPLFVVEFARVHLGEGDYPINISASSEVALPMTIQVVMEMRLAGLSTQAQVLVGPAAVIGRAFSTTLLAHIVGAANNDDLIVRGLDELWQRRIIREHGGESYDFSHDKLRAVAYAALSPARRRQLHQRTAQALATHYATTLDTVSGQIAHHYHRSGMWVPAVQYYELAAATARDIYAHQDALAALDHALTLLDAWPTAFTTPQADIARLQEQRGVIAAWGGQYTTSLAAFHAALAVIAPSEQVQRARLYRLIAQTWRDQLRYDECLQACAQAIASLGNQPVELDPAWWQEWISIQLIRTMGLFFQAQIDALDETIHRLQAVIDHYGTPSQQALLLGTCAALQFRRERYVPSPETIRWLRQALVLHETYSTLQDTAIARFGLGYGLMLIHELDEAETHLQDALRESERLEDPLTQTRCVAFQSVIQRIRGNLTAVQQGSTELLGIAVHGPFFHYMAIAHANLAWVAWRSAQWDVAESNCQRALELWGPPELGPYQWLVLWLQIALLLRHHRIAEASSCARLLLHPTQQRLPDDLTQQLQVALQMWEQHNEVAAHKYLLHAVEQAQFHDYL